MRSSIFNMIESHTVIGGPLPRRVEEGFTLPEGNTKWAPGAVDGISVYHMVPYTPDDKDMEKIARAAFAAGSGDREAAEEAILTLTKENGTVRIAPALRRYIADHVSEIDTEALFRTSVSLMHESAHIECVKMGMALLELFRFSEEDVRTIVRILGAYDEFTLFAVRLMLKWENGSGEIFRLAKVVRGWGRIHAVNYLEPETDEIRRWLLTDGARNTVLPAYSASVCWDRSQAEKILFAGPTPEEFAAIGFLINALLDEGPVTGISGIENAKSILTRFLDLAKPFALVDTDPALLEHIRVWAEEHRMPDIADLSMKRLTGD